MLVALFILAWLTPDGAQFAPHSVPFLESDTLAMEIFVPKSWGCVELPPDPHSLRTIQIAVNNRGDDALCVRAFPEGDAGLTRWIDGGPQGFAATLEPGTVYLEVGLFMHHPVRDVTPHAWTPKDRVEKSVHPIERFRRPTWEDKDGVAYQSRFKHWGEDWVATVYARKPYSRRALDRAFAILKSLRLPDTPVVDSRQAIELALRAVPMDFRRAAAKAERDCCESPLRVEAEETAGGFRVDFRILGTTPREGKYAMAVS